ncbi:MAG: hypothetical protein HGA96_05500 [Desulfobulbaceae bacterium]|nr:hypothetical protein [Desulfobulbaceae bacterium]
MLMAAAKFKKKAELTRPAQEQGAEGESCRITGGAPEPEGGVASFADLDRLDRLALALLLLLLVASLFLVVRQSGGPDPLARPGVASLQSGAVASPDFANKMATAVALLNGGDLARTGQMLDALIVEFPYEGGPHMLKGDLFLRDQQAIAAMLEYRQGVDLNPDYLDKKMPELFQGKKVKRVLEEARVAITAGLARTPGDPALRQQREVLYYMLRKVAGSCG